MLRRFLLVGMFALLGTAGLAAPSGPTDGVLSEPAERLRITCTGTMMTADMPPWGSPIMADGLIDFTAHRVNGFGIGSQPIVVLTASDISFGSSPPEGEQHGNTVEGTIDRLTGKTHVVVRSPRDPTDIRIEMGLDCEFERPVS